MNVAEVLDEIATRLDAIDGLRVHAWGEKRVSPPAVLLPFPPVEYDLTTGRGTDELEFTMVLLVGDHSARASRNALAEYVNGSGAKSIKQAVDSTNASGYASCDAVVVDRFDPDVLRFAGADYLGGVFRGTITGEGAD